jgi:hypothetical protein
MTTAKGEEHGGKARIDGFIPAITLAQAALDKKRSKGPIVGGF